MKPHFPARVYNRAPRRKQRISRTLYIKSPAKSNSSSCSLASYERGSKKRCSSRHIRRSMGSGGGDASSVLSSGGRTQKSSGSSKLSHGATARDSGGSSGHCTHRSEPPPRIQVSHYIFLEEQIYRVCSVLIKTSIAGTELVLRESEMSMLSVCQYNITHDKFGIYNCFVRISSTRARLK